MNKDELLKRAEELAGRPVELEQTQDGQWIVLWMSFGALPPPKAATEEAALQGFIDMMLQRKAAGDNLPEEDTDGRHSGTDAGSTAGDDRPN